MAPRTPARVSRAIDTTATDATDATDTPKVRKTKFNFDDVLEEEFPDGDDDVPTVEIGPLFGANFTLLKTPNAWTQMGMAAAVAEERPDSTARMYDFMIALIHPKDRQRFRAAMARQANMSDEKLSKIFLMMMEAVADGRPTTTSSGANRSQRRAAGKRQSRVR